MEFYEATYTHIHTILKAMPRARFYFIIINFNQMLQFCKSFNTFAVIRTIKQKLGFKTKLTHFFMIL